MKRSFKNLIMILAILIVCGAVFLTINYAKNNVNVNMPNMNSSDNPSAMPNSVAGENENQIPPSMPNNDSGENENQVPPSIPNNSSENDNSASNNNVDMENPPEKPNEDGNAANQMPIDENGSVEVFNNGLSWLYYFVFVVENMIMAILLMYLIMSMFNKKSFKEIFTNKDRILIYVLSIIIITFGCTYLDGKISNSLISNNMSETDNKSENNSSIVSYSAEKEITKDTTITEGSFDSTSSDENAILVNGNIDVKISDVLVNKTGDSDGGDNTSFYGINSSILAKSGANLTLRNITIKTNADGANGVFSYGGSATTDNSSSDGTTITISDSNIKTSKDNSGGIMTTGGGKMVASNLTINTAGVSSAAIRTDRGGGTVTVNGGTYTTTGAGSPTIYSTADIKVSSAKLISEASEGIVIEGKNSVTIEGVTLTDTNNKLNGQSTTYKNIFLYQSMSGDASTGTSKFTAKNSKITTNKGDTFYITNTTATINLENNTFSNNDNDSNFLRAQKDSWGNSGSNGGDVTLVMKNQNTVGNIVIDSISTLDMTMKSNSYYKGTINGNNSAKSIKLTLDKSSKIKLTGDSYITSLENADPSNGNIDFNGYKLYVNKTAIN